MFQPRAGLLESLALLCKSWHRPAGECEVTPFSGFINRLPGQAPVSTEHRRGDEYSWGARVAWGSEAGLLRPRDGGGRRLKSSQAYQQGLWEQANQGRGELRPPTGCANPAELLSLSG